MHLERLTLQNIHVVPNTDVYNLPIELRKPPMNVVGV